LGSSGETNHFSENQDQDVFSGKLEEDRCLESVRVVGGRKVAVSVLWVEEEFSEAMTVALITM